VSRNRSKHKLPQAPSEESPTQIRLQKFLSQCGVASRRHAEQMIREGDIQVNDVTVTELGVKVNPDKDIVRVKRRIVKPPPKGILLLHKPRGVVSTLHDPEGRPTVADFLTKHYQSYFPVGRLDWDSTGLIILTNDGELAEHLMHPRYGFDRVYHVRVEGSVSDRLVQKIEAGVRLEDGLIKGKAKILKGDDGSTWLEVLVKEGRNRVVRRMMDKLKHPVIKLRRVSYGPFKLGTLKPGELRKLNDKEYRVVRERVLKKKSESAEG
jgi:23S rRNA pseudouridine2605 synthase